MTAEREAWFQGSRVRLDLNAETAARLRDALDRIIRSGPSGAAALARLDVRLPDECPLRLSVRLTDTDTIHQVDDTHRTSERAAYVDVSGDFDTHVAARQVIDAATRQYVEVPRSEWSGRRLAAPRWTRCSSWRCAVARGC